MGGFIWITNAIERLTMNNLKFIHITKTGGSTIEDIAFEKNILFGIHHQKEYGFWHELPSMKSMNLLQKYDWFTFVRNPYERMISEFYCKWGGLGQA